MFENFISLGTSCVVAAALSKHGLRSAAGPFDWCVSPFESVLTLMETDFCDFMNYDNLKVEKDREWVFYDKKYKIQYPHEIKTSLDVDYKEITEKYKKRIQLFRGMIQKRTCFVRGIAHMSELSFLVEAEARIGETIKCDSGNEIIFVVPRHIYEQNPISSKFKIFLVDNLMIGYQLGREESRCFFDTNQELIDFCVNNYDVNKRKDNLIFDLQKEMAFMKKADASEDDKITFLKNKIIEQRRANIIIESSLRRWEKVVNSDYTSINYEGKISIYGCGAIGRTLYNYMKKRFSIIEFIDRSPRQAIYDGIPVNTIKDSISDKDTLIIIVPSYDLDKIRLDLARQYDFSPNTISIEEFLSKAKLLDPYF